jgi:hypothetical protein
MSVDYLLPAPLTVAEVEQKTGWRLTKNREGHDCFTNGAYYVFHDMQDGKVTGFTRYAGNDCDQFAADLGAISEFDDEYFRHFNGSML